MPYALRLYFFPLFLPGPIFFLEGLRFRVSDLDFLDPVEESDHDVGESVCSSL